jgi:uncharacterized membrane protein SpoIIM required for sporulation
LERYARARTELGRFESLLALCEKRDVSRLAFEDLRELGRLYRQHTTLLARARHRRDDPEVVRHLNALCTRAYTFLYANARAAQSESRSLGDRVSLAMGRSYVPIAVAWALLAVGIAVGAGLSSRDVAAVHTLMPAQFGYDGPLLDELIGEPEARLEFLQPEATAAHVNTLFGSQLFSHNTRVGLTSFALGVLGAIPPILLMLYNGIIVGSIGWVFMRGGTAVPFLAWILPHGIPEFTAIVLCTAAGLSMGLAVVAPGRVGRAIALRDAAETATTLVLLSVPFFLIAAMIESFVRQSALGIGIRLGVAVAMGALLVGGMLWLRSRARSREADTAWIYESILPGADRGSG